MPYRITPQGEDDIFEIASYIAQDNPTAADALVDRIHERCEVLAKRPEIGRSREELAPRLRSFPIGNYIVFYRPTDYGVEVIRVLSGYRDFEGLFE